MPSSSAVCGCGAPGAAPTTRARSSRAVSGKAFKGNVRCAWARISAFASAAGLPPRRRRSWPLPPRGAVALDTARALTEGDDLDPKNFGTFDWYSKWYPVGFERCASTD